jgi:D-galactarolactone cycloisomerase
MKIVDVEIIPLSYAIDDKPARRRYFAVLKLSTDKGIVGWGEASDCYGHSHPMIVKAIFDEHLKWMLLGKDPLEVEKLIHDLRIHNYYPLGGRELIIQAISAIDIALWDIRGKVYDKPISELLGQLRSDIELYAAGRPAFFDPYESHVRFFEDLLNKGVKAVKIRTGYALEWDINFVKSMRNLLPEDIQILVDGKYNYTFGSALRLASVLAEINAVCFEEPIVDANLGMLSELAARSSVPLAYGEHSFTAHDFRELIKFKAAQILEPDVTICGGITEAKKITALAEAHDLPIYPHCGGLTAIGLAANLHFASSVPNLGLFEYDARDVQPLKDEILVDPIFSNENIIDGRMPVPTGPGLGININESIFLKYPYFLDKEIAGTYTVYGTPHV